MAASIQIAPVTIPIGTTTLPNPLVFPTGVALPGTITKIDIVLDRSLFTVTTATANLSVEISEDGGVAWQSYCSATFVGSTDGLTHLDQGATSSDWELISAFTPKPSLNRRIRVTAVVTGQAWVTSGGLLTVN